MGTASTGEDRAERYRPDDRIAGFRLLSEPFTVENNGLLTLRR
jgi:hypothetical protein